MEKVDRMTSKQASPKYQPLENDDFMNEEMREYFRQKLLKWREELVQQSTGTLITLQEEAHKEPDIADRASAEVELGIELRTRDRERKLISKIDSALERIALGTYGYCEETGEPIGIGRLEARPIATLTLEAQERHERQEKIYRDE
jgi:DnaK suppressor protein